MITRLKETETGDLTPQDVERYLAATGKVNVLYRSRAILEIGVSDATAGEAGYRVVFKDYEPLGCCDDWSPVGRQFFALSRQDEAIACFIHRLRHDPAECWPPPADPQHP
ncbi:hypothetical protein [Propionivibrio sp.]|uniref:hypothetical protein n=1 Tax=Propionivibrio sp. TaxID=2212460 RepID=UPI0039E5EE6E